jgi:hypothetical protein
MAFEAWLSEASVPFGMTFDGIKTMLWTPVHKNANTP